MSFNMHVTRQIPEEGINILKKFCQTVEVNPHDRPLTYDELFVDKLKDYCELCSGI